MSSKSKKSSGTKAGAKKKTSSARPGSGDAVTGGAVDTGAGWIADLLCALVDVNGAADTAVKKAFRAFEKASMELIAARNQLARHAEIADRAVTVTSVLTQMKIFDGDNSVKPALVELFASQFEDPEKARGFLSCPPLSDSDVEQLVSGVRSPTNAYERFASSLKSRALREELCKAESQGPVERFTYRAMKLTDESRRRIREARGNDLGENLFALETIRKEPHRMDVTVEPVWSWLRSVLPKSDADLELERIRRERGQGAPQERRPLKRQERMIYDLLGKNPALLAELLLDTNPEAVQAMLSGGDGKAKPAADRFTKEELDRCAANDEFSKKRQ